MLLVLNMFKYIRNDTAVRYPVYQHLWKPQQLKRENVCLPIHGNEKATKSVPGMDLCGDKFNVKDAIVQEFNGSSSTRHFVSF